MRKERKILRFVPQKLRKSFAVGNPSLNLLHKEKISVQKLNNTANQNNSVINSYYSLLETHIVNVNRVC